MAIKPITAALLALAAAGCASPGPVYVAPPFQATGPGVLQGTQCLDPDFARSWINLDRRTLLVDAGRYKYRLEVASACSALDYSHVLRFRGDPISGRVCGGAFDAILTRDYPCRIERMDQIDKAQYRAMLEHRAQARKRPRPRPVGH